jgi:DNA-directed RNA polymerase
VLSNTDLIEKVKTVSPGRANFRMTYAIVPTKAAQEWVEQHHEAAKLLNPDSMPCIIPPDPWTSRKQGGYYTPQMRSRNPLIKTTNRLHRKIIDNTDISMIIDAVNFTQRTPWQVNTDVLSVVREVWAKNLPIGMPQSQKIEVPDSPFKDMDKATMSEEHKLQLLNWKREAAELYRMEKDRVAKAFQTTRIMRMANEFSEYENFWFVWYADFRGRMYTSTNSFSPQGPDIAKALLRFGEGKRLGSRGWFWLKVHVANKFGNDKCDFEDRVKWTEEQHEMLCAIAADPIAHAKMWANADKPWQFLAAVLEYVNAANYRLVGGQPEDFISRLPIGQDGSCNGLQHFSAMLRDPVGGRATNLIPGKVPADIYSQVGSVFAGKVRKSDLPEWIAFEKKHGIPRHMPKRPVMTLPYGSTQRSCTGYIYDAIVKTDKTAFEHAFQSAMVATPMMWQSIGEVVIAAREIMDWLQECASKISKRNLPILWTTPDGFHVFQGNYDIESHCIKTQLQGQYLMRVCVITDNLSSRKQRQAISPNFVHSMDSAHLRRVLKRMSEQGISSVAAIHDDYGTHACDTDNLRDIIRTSFADMYIEHDPVAKFYADQVARRVKLTPPPAKGTLDLELVKQSGYFFG